jgi:hypothetical protein
VEAGAGGAEVAFPVYYWPGWRATVDGAPVEVAPVSDSGYLTLVVPAGQHTVVMWLGRTPLRAVAEGVSLAAVLGVLLLVIVSWRPRASRFLPPAFCFVGLVIALTLLVTLSPGIATTGDADLTMDFEKMPYLHHNPDGVDFDWWRMTGYHYSADNLAPGDTLHVTLDWEWRHVARDVGLGGGARGE